MPAQKTKKAASPAKTISHSAYEITLDDVIEFARKNIKTLTYIPAGFLVAALLYILMATPKYSASAQVSMETEYAGIERIETVGRFDGAQVESQLTLLRSKSIAHGVIKLLELDKKRAAEKKAAKPSSGWFSSSKKTKPQSKAAIEHNMTELVQKGLKVQRVGYSYVLEILYLSPDAEKAATYANAFADAYVADKLNRREEAARRGASWLETQLNRLRRHMNQAALDVQVFKARGDYRLQDRTLSLDSSAPLEATVKKEDEPLTLDSIDAISDEPTLEELESRALTYRRIFESYLRTYADTVQKQAYPVTNARVISRAYPPKRPSHPNKLKILAAALLIGAAIGFGLSLFRYNLPGLRQILGLTKG